MDNLYVEKNVGGIEDLCVLIPRIHRDHRGYFAETYNKNDLEKNGLFYDFVQDNQSSSIKGVLRGLHFQEHYPQAKLVRVIQGRVFDVAVDLRKSSSTYGKYYGLELSADNHKQFLIPRGFAHGFVVVSDVATFCYKCDAFYHPEDEKGILWNDPDIGIRWPLADIPEAQLLFSEKDKKWPLFHLI